MSEADLRNYGGLTVGDSVWFVLKDGYARQGKVLGFFVEEGKETAVSVRDETDQKHRYMKPDHLSRVPLDDTKKKRHRKVKEKRERRSTKVF